MIVFSVQQFYECACVAFNSGQSPFPGYPYNATPAGLNQSYGAVGSQQGFAGM